MKINVRDCYDRLTKEISAVFRTPDGMIGQVRTEIDRRTMENDPYAYTETIKCLKEQIQAVCNQQIDQGVINNMPTIMATNEPQAYRWGTATASGAWTTTAGIGTTAGDTATLTTEHLQRAREQMMGVPGQAVFLDENQMGTTPYQNVTGWSASPREFKVRLKIGRHELSIYKSLSANGELEITDADIAKAKVDFIKDKHVTIITNRAERKAESLLKTFISEVDFRNYKKKGFFTVKSGNRVFRIWQDNHKHIDMWERNRNLLVPKNRLCVHTPNREVPLADEVLSKLLLIRSGSILERSNHHPVYELEHIREEDLITV